MTMTIDTNDLKQEHYHFKKEEAASIMED